LAELAGIGKGRQLSVTYYVLSVECRLRPRPRVLPAVCSCDEDGFGLDEGVARCQLARFVFLFAGFFMQVYWLAVQSSKQRIVIFFYACTLSFQPFGHEACSFYGYMTLNQRVSTVRVYAGKPVEFLPASQQVF
jgi:hypothetical protein